MELSRLPRVRASLLWEAGAVTLRLAGVPSAVAAAEGALWRRLGDASTDSHGGWAYLDDAGVAHGPVDMAALRGWSGRAPPGLPLRHAASSAWLPLRALLPATLHDGHFEEGARDDAAASPMETDEDAAADELALRRHAHADDEAMPDVGAGGASSPPAGAVRLVVDTCVLLTRLPRLAAAVASLRGFAVCHIPWVALTELDGLSKACEARPLVARQAREANSSLAALFARGDPCWTGEGAGEGREAARDAGASASNDDRLLHTTLRLRSAGVRAALLSNDTNLRVKAAVSGVPSLTDDRFLALAAAAAAGGGDGGGLAALEAAVGQGLHANGGAPRGGDALTAEQSRGTTQQEHAQPVAAPPAAAAAPHIDNNAADDPMSRALDLIARGAWPVLSHIFEAELGPLWLDVLKLPDAGGASGHEVLRVVRRHSRLVQLPQRCAACAEACESAARGGDARAAAAAGSALLAALPPRAEGRGEREAARAALDALASSLR